MSIGARDPARVLRPGLVFFAMVQLAVGAFMAIAPGAFHDDIGPYGPTNDHYTRDNATFTLALGVAMLVAAQRPRWRGPVLGLALLQDRLHAINHLADISKADPKWLGPA